MVGSLVIVFPTPHEGGTLVLSKDGESGEQWSFDAPKLLAEATPGAPEIAFVAFYSDVTHEVLPVASGARVTLTFNLFFDDIVKTNASSENLMKHDMVKDAVQELIDDPEVFPEGGILGFGLAHQYALKRTSSGLGYQLSELIGYLKGSDALVYKVCRDLGLDVTLKTYYISNEDREYMGSNFIADQDQIDDDSELYEGLTRMDDGSDEDEEDGGKGGRPSLVWVTAMNDENGAHSSYVAYGNESSVAYAYGSVWLAVERATKQS